MADQLGRLIIIQQPDGANPGQFLNVCGFRDRNFNIANGAVEEINHDCTNLSQAPTRGRSPGIQDHNFSGSGKYSDDANGTPLADAAEANTVLTGWKIIVPGFGSYVGNWMVSNYVFTGAIEGSMTFSCDIAQTEDPVFTAAV